MHMIEHCIRLSGADTAFYYSVRRDGVVVASEAVPVGDVLKAPELDPECEYYGGSQVMD